MTEDISTKGLDDFGSKFLAAPNAAKNEIIIKSGQKASDEAIAKYLELRKEEFIKRAGSFTEDLVGFIKDQKIKRGLDDTEVVFGIALANINLRNSYASPQNEEEKKTYSELTRKAQLKEWDEICWGAQQYYDENV